MGNKSNLDKVGGDILGQESEPVSPEAIKEQDKLYPRDLSAEQFAVLADLHRRNLQQDTLLRLVYSIITPLLIILWIIVVINIVIADGKGLYKGCPFDLPNGVIYALLGTVTANIVGLFWVIMNYLFYHEKKS